MNNITTNSSESTSPAGIATLKAATNNINTSTSTFSNSSNPVATDQQANSQDKLDIQPIKLTLTKSLTDSTSDPVPDCGESAKPTVPKQNDLPTGTESLRVKIKTNNITNTIVATSTNDSNNNSNNKNTANNASNSSTTTSGSTNTSTNINNKPTTEAPAVGNEIGTVGGVLSKSSSGNSKAGGRKAKQNNGDSSSSATSNSTSANSSFSSTTSSSSALSSSAMSTPRPQSIMSNHDNSTLVTENGNKTAMSSSSTSALLPADQPSQLQPGPPTQQQQLAPMPSQIQSQQPPLPSLPPPQVSTQPNLAVLAPTRLPSGQATTATTPKPKATRAKKQPAANNKNAAGATNTATPPKPEAKTRTKKAKQTAETKATAAAAATIASFNQLQPISSTAPASNLPASSSASDKKVSDKERQTPSTPAKKRKPRAPPATETTAQPTNPPKRTRKKKADQVASTLEGSSKEPSPCMPLGTNMPNLPPLSVNPQLLSVASTIPVGTSPLMSSAPQSSYPSMQPLNINRNIPGMSPLDVHDPSQRYVSVSLSPYANYDYTNSLARQHSLSKLLFTSSSSSALNTNPHSDEIAKAFEELRDHTWSHLSKSILEPAQQFDIPSLIGTLYELRADNEKHLKRVKELTLQREQLAAMNAKLDLTGPMLLQNLNQTSPSFASVVASLQNSPKSLPNSSPSPAMNKSPIVPGGAYNHVPPGSSLGPPGILYDRSSPMVGMPTQHSGVNSLKSSMISTPSPPTSAFLAHGANNRAGLMTVNNSPYMSNVHPSINAINPLGGPAPPSYYPRQ